MGSFIRRNAIFFLFPAVVVAIVFLARFNLMSALRFGEWGERSIVESTLVLAKEKVERVERTISDTDHAFFRIVDPNRLGRSCEMWHAVIRGSRLVEAAAIVHEETEVVDFFYRGTDLAETDAAYTLIVEEVLPLLDKYESLYQHKHLHRIINGEYRLVTSLTREFEGEDYTAILLYDTKEVTGHFFEDLLGDVGSDRTVNVVDDGGRVIFGGNLEGAGEFIVVKRFPSTLYKWKVQLAPRSAAFFSNSAKTQKYSQWTLIPLSFAVIVFGLVVLYMAMVRERRLNRLKSEFIANTSHELKTPLALIRMFAELLSMGRVKDENKAKRYHEIILRETERLSSLIDNVLDYAKIERGKSAYEFRTTSLSDVVEPAIEVYSYRIAEADARLSYECQEDLPDVNIDGDAISLALINLIDNAVPEHPRHR